MDQIHGPLPEGDALTVISDKVMSELRKAGWRQDETIMVDPIDNEAASTIEGAFMLATRMHGENITVNAVKAEDSPEALGVFHLTTGKFPEKHICGSVLFKNQNISDGQFLEEKQGFMSFIDRISNNPIYSRSKPNKQLKP